MKCGYVLQDWAAIQNQQKCLENKYCSRPLSLQTSISTDLSSKTAQKHLEKVDTLIYLSRFTTEKRLSSGTHLFLICILILQLNLEPGNAACKTRTELITMI